jgi:hypothetical protein
MSKVNIDLNCFMDVEVDNQKLLDAQKKYTDDNAKKKSYVSAGAFKQNLGEDSFDFEKEKAKFVDNMNWLKSMSVEEYTFYKKWEEVKDSLDLIEMARQVKPLIWKPTDINDEKRTTREIENLDPVIVQAKNEEELSHWLVLRVYCHTMSFNQSPCRFIKFIIKDRLTGKYLGVTSIASDVPTIGAREKYIGWTAENRVEQGKLNFSAIGSCIMSTQPFGYNFLGGKLIACLLTTKPVRETWESMYKDRLVGLTTTSLYGRPSMYDGLEKWWYACGETEGQIVITPDNSAYNVWHHWLKQHRSEEYNKMMTQKEGVSGPPTSPKQKVINMIFSSVGLKVGEYKHGHKKGAYYSLIYENGKDFLCNRIEENKLTLRPVFEKDRQVIIDWWKPKAIKRYRKLKFDGNIKPDVLFYKDMVGMKYDESKKTYFGEVGR